MQQSMVDLVGADPQSIAIVRHRLVDVFYPVAALAIRDLATTARHVAKPGSKIGLKAALQHHFPLYVAIAILHADPGDRVVPLQAPALALRHRQLDQYLLVGIEYRQARRVGPGHSPSQAQQAESRRPKGAATLSEEPGASVHKDSAPESMPLRTLVVSHLGTYLLVIAQRAIVEGHRRGVDGEIDSGIV